LNLIQKPAWALTRSVTMEKTVNDFLPPRVFRYLPAA
jgi:hypothetical protein